MTRSSLLCQFDQIASKKMLGGDLLKKEAHLFWTWAMLKGYENCPFPEWLIKFHLGEWEPFSD